MLAISIHALPRKNATNGAEPPGCAFGISIHALPRKNATCGATGSACKTLNFNPRTPSQECDFNRFHYSYLPNHFNPRTPSQECDMSAAAKYAMKKIFQSTHSLARMRQQSLPKIPSNPFNFLSLLYPSSLKNSTFIFPPHHILP